MRLHMIVRFFLAVPLLIVAEVIVGPRLTAAGMQFVQAGFVRTEDYPAFDHAIARAAKRRESLWAELILLGAENYNRQKSIFARSPKSRDDSTRSQRRRRSRSVRSNLLFEIATPSNSLHAIFN
jgi:hypothetical protein